MKYDERIDEWKISVLSPEEIMVYLDHYYGTHDLDEIIESVK
jgi:hypothetical protein